MGSTPAENPSAYQAATVAQPAIATVLLHGDADVIVPLKQAEVPGIPKRIVPGAGHFDWVHTDTAAFTTLLTTLQEMLAP